MYSFDLSNSIFSLDLNSIISKENSKDDYLINLNCKYNSNFTFLNNFDNTFKGLSIEEKENLELENKEEILKSIPFGTFNFDLLKNSSNIVNKNNVNIKIKNEKKSKANNFLGRKIIFETVELNSSKIFTVGGYDINSLKVFKDSLSQKNKNAKKMKNSEIIENNNLQNNKKKRKYYTDEIRTKFIGYFFKHLIRRLNKKLECAKSSKVFNSIPPKCINKITSNIIQAINSQNIVKIAKNDLTLEEIISINFCEKGKENNDKIENIYKENNEVLKFLENNSIGELICFNIIKKKKFSEIFDEYLKSQEFKSNIYDLKYQKKEDVEYIKIYINKAFIFLKNLAQ